MIRGYEDVVKKLAQVPVDAKDRPQTPIVISNCGELELRRPKPVVEQTSRMFYHLFQLTASCPIQFYAGENRKNRKRHDSRERSRSRSADGERRRKKSKMRIPKPDPQRDEPQRSEANIVPQETEEEYDARLEREEQERMAKAKRNRLERIQQMHENSNSAQGVRFKGILTGYPFGMQYLISPHCLVIGRGRMKFVDPELHHRQ